MQCPAASDQEPTQAPPCLLQDAYFLKAALTRPKMVLLVQIGDFFESWGFSAIVSQSLCLLFALAGWIEMQRLEAVAHIIIIVVVACPGQAHIL
jgi:hypothetical protein